MERARKISNHKPLSVYKMERKRKNRTVADMNALNITTTEEEPKQEDEEDEEDEEEEFVKYGAVDEFYELEKEIGKGAYGTVKRCTHKTKKKNYAAKIIKTANNTVRKTVLREIEVMRALGTHNKLVELVDAYQTPFEIVMVLELVEGGELFERIVAEEYLMEDDAVDYVKQILEALQFMHERHVVHLDLKPENILCISMNSNDIKLVDFGLARSLDSEEEVKSSFGTPDFVAPEVIRMKPVSTASDLWSLGVVTYVLLSGLMPFSGDDDHQTLVKVAKADWDFDDECFDDLSHDAMEFIEGLLVKEPSERLTIEECFQHSWIKDTHDTGTKINTQNHKAFMAQRRWKKSVNALLAVRRISLSPLFGSKRRRSMDPSILAAASESEEDQHNDVDRKVSAPVDPSELSLPNRRVGETRSSCFGLDMATIKALQEKADKSTEKGTQSDEKENDNDNETVETDSDLNESVELSATCYEEQESEGSAVERDNGVDQERYTSPRRRANTFCGSTFKETRAATSRERKISQISINVGNSSQNDFKPVSFTFNAEDIKRIERRILESATISNARPKLQAFQQDSTTINGDVEAENSMDVSVLATPGSQFDKISPKPQTLTLQLDKSILTEGFTEPPEIKADELPTICVNDELYLSSPPPIKMALNNNIEKEDRERRASTPPPSLKTTSTINIGNVNKIPDSVQAITVQLGNLNGLQLNSKEVTCSVRRASTGSAPC
ncbi:calcium/calmodulin-dependent protein kinase type IV-like isoform X2 [Stylophora pistillata]|uniref:calcium/calmodulin-dependent protein kinase type IV-like isoform X2 n=2 Tax=Stylophora pistillata TaxID=50429 RepID=UPI000C05074B|nr:calcium/calmodulin-dependent protein kinase type IV-like isoform X2 [Stylophora pistillata]